MDNIQMAEKIKILCKTKNDKCFLPTLLQSVECLKQETNKKALI